MYVQIIQQTSHSGSIRTLLLLSFLLLLALYVLLFLQMALLLAAHFLRSIQSQDISRIASLLQEASFSLTVTSHLQSILAYPNLSSSVSKLVSPNFRILNRRPHTISAWVPASPSFLDYTLLSRLFHSSTSTTTTNPSTSASTSPVSFLSMLFRLPPSFPLHSTFFPHYFSSTRGLGSYYFLALYREALSKFRLTFGMFAIS